MPAQRTIMILFGKPNGKKNLTGSVCQESPGFGQNNLAGNITEKSVPSLSFRMRRQKEKKRGGRAPLFCEGIEIIN